MKNRKPTSGIGTMSASKSLAGEKILAKFLSVIGLLTKDIQRDKGTRFRTCRAVLLIATSILAFIFEVTCNVIFINIKSKSAAGTRVTDIVWATKYYIKTISTILVLGLFWWKSSAITAINQAIRSVGGYSVDALKADRITRHCNWFAWLALLGYVQYMIGVTFTRAADIYAHPWRSGLFSEYSFMYEEIIALIIRNYTEPIRVLCTGYLVLALVRFGDGLAAECLSLLESSVAGHLQDTLEGAWAARERAIKLSTTIHRELQPLITSIIVADISCLIGCVGEVLANQNTFQRVRLVGATFLYLVSMLSLLYGLICITEKDEMTLEALQEACSRNTYNSSRELTTKNAGQENAHLADYARLFSTQVFGWSCFGKRQVALDLYGFGRVTSTTVISISGAFVAFFCFLVEQNDRSIAATQGATTGTSNGVLLNASFELSLPVSFTSDNATS
ncbi:hypothetical protein BV898_06204 [Hypsibius exemplaris]|uniref:Gustatory receptor n=1 Tax=Hypsibius exemplaris TaxID=2072580 RepID=A0A1W0WXL7_HYPEX|nr:hypothetical protein BV898_06204 [Hypsibius exemplaris]